MAKTKKVSKKAGKKTSKVAKKNKKVSKKTSKLGKKAKKVTKKTSKVSKKISKVTQVSSFSITSAKIKSFSVDSNKITIKLKGPRNKHKNFTCLETAKHYNAVVSTTIYAHSADLKIEIKHSLSIVLSSGQGTAKNPKEINIDGLGLGEDSF